MPTSLIKFKWILAPILIFMLVTPLTLTQKVLAQSGGTIMVPAPGAITTSPGHPVMDTAVQMNTFVIANTLSGLLPGQQQDKAKSTILMTIVKRLLREVTKSVVTWINSGFNGNPSFITNTNQFLNDTADITIGDFLMNDPALSFLCDPFKIQVKLALGLQYRPFKEQIACSFTSAVGNVNDAMNNFLNGDFIGGGGWDAWLQMTTVPQNNQMGAMIIAQSEMDARIEAQKGAAVMEANWGAGFLSWKDCKTYQTSSGVTSDAASTAYSSGGTVRYTDAASGGTGISTDDSLDRVSYYNKTGELIGSTKENMNCTIITPGSFIADQLTWFSTSDLRQSELANDLNEVFNALLNQLLVQGVSFIKDQGLLGGSKPKENTTAQDISDYLNNLQAQLTSQNNSESGINTGPYNSDGSINFNQTFVNRAIALDTINSQIAIENQYFAAQTNIYNLLDATQNAFISSSCSDSEKTEVISQITGNYAGVKDLIWNKTDITNASAATTNNVSALNTVAAAVTSATNDSSVPSIVQPLITMTTLHSATSVSNYSTGGTTFESIKTWIITTINNNATSCTIDKSGLVAWGIN